MQASKRPRTQAMNGSAAYTGGLPQVTPDVLAFVLRDASITDVMHVAHTCRSLHAMVHGLAQCTCATRPFGERDDESAPTRAFWSHWVAERTSAPKDDERSFKQHASANRPTLVHYWLRANMDPSVAMDHALRWACRHGNGALVDALLRDARVRADSRRNTPIRWASGSGRADIVRRLLHEPSVDPTACEGEALRVACTKGHAPVVRLLLCGDSSPLDRNTDDAACATSSAAIRDLIADCNTAHARRFPANVLRDALCSACAKGRLLVVESLVHGHWVSGDALSSALTAAAARGHDPIVKLLLRQTHILRHFEHVVSALDHARRLHRWSTMALLAQHLATLSK